MTCVVGLIHDGVVHMGGDTLASEQDDHNVVRRADPKVFVRGMPTGHGDMLFGFCGSYRVGQLLCYNFGPPEVPNGRDDMEYMVTDFIDGWRSLLRKKGALKVSDEIEEHAATLLVGWRGSLYVIDNDLSVGQPDDNYYAIGSGAPYAIGSLYTSRDVLIDDPVRRITLALNAAVEYNAACRAPYTVLSAQCP